MKEVPQFSSSRCKRCGICSHFCPVGPSTPAMAACPTWPTRRPAPRAVCARDMCPDWAVALETAAGEVPEEKEAETAETAAEPSGNGAGSPEPCQHPAIDQQPASMSDRAPKEGLMEKVIYLDHASTTPADPEVVAAMLPWLSEEFGNPSTVYSLGLTAAQAVQQARESIADAHRRRARRDLFHQRRHRVGQLGRTGYGGGSAEEGPPPHHLRGIEHHAVLESMEYPGETRLRGHPGTRGRRGSRRS